MYYGVYVFNVSILIFKIKRRHFNLSYFSFKRTAFGVESVRSSFVVTVSYLNIEHLEFSINLFACLMTVCILQPAAVFYLFRFLESLVVWHTLGCRLVLNYITQQELNVIPFELSTLGGNKSDHVVC